MLSLLCGCNQHHHHHHHHHSFTSFCHIILFLVIVIICIHTYQVIACHHHLQQYLPERCELTFSVAIQTHNMCLITELSK